MSETEQKETEFVAGSIIGIIQKAADKWQVEVQPDGSQYTKKLWTKDAELVTAVTQKIGSQGAFVCGVSHWTNNEGKSIRSLWINEVGGENAPSSVATPVATPKAVTPSAEGMSKDEWARKDSAIHKTALIKAAADALKHTITSDPTYQDLNTFNEHVLHLALGWHRSVIAERDDPTGEGIPF